MELEEALLKDVEKRFGWVVLDVHRVIVENTPVSNEAGGGRLRVSIQPEQINRFEWVIGTNIPYAEFVETGTGLFGPKHQLIFPVKGNVMAWMKGGEAHFSRWTRGMPGSHMFLKGYNTFEASLNEHFSKE